MMERFGRGVAMSWRENNIKNEEQGGEEEVEDGFRKATFGSARIETISNTLLDNSAKQSPESKQIQEGLQLKRYPALR
ncbi:hypothetical protein J6590_077335 [Homalodisca vitripennis]|nr:hypothetical protein J6590_077335 [Homalodisca vitripennis]